MIRQFIFHDVSPGFYRIQDLAKYFSDMDAPLLCELISDAIQAEGYSVQDAYLQGLFLSILIAINRIVKGQHITSSGWEALRNSYEYEVADNLSKMCDTQAGIRMRNADVLYITSLLYGQLKPEKSQSATIDLIDVEFESLIFELLSSVLNDFLIPIHYSTYIKNLARHIKDLLRRAENQNYVVSMMYENVRTNLPFVYEVAVHFAEALNKHFRIEIPNDEIGFLGVYIGLLIETVVLDTNKIDIGVNSSNYLDINSKLESLFKKYDDDAISIENISISSDSSYYGKKPDIIITTTPLTIVGKRVINISPLLTSDDQNKIDSAIRETIKEKNTQRYYSSLHTFFNNKLFFIRSDISTKEAAIEFLGKKLIDNGFSNEGFIESVIKREQLSSTCFFDAFAVPHALEMNSNQTAFAVLINDKGGILWDKHRIKLCILMAVCESERRAFSQTYNNIVRVLSDMNRLRSLTRCTNLPEFLSELKSIR